jgi:hypothetical protein
MDFIECQFLMASTKKPTPTLLSECPIRTLWLYKPRLNTLSFPPEGMSTMTVSPIAPSPRSIRYTPWGAILEAAADFRFLRAVDKMDSTAVMG